jgi:hypothetical protein
MVFNWLATLGAFVFCALVLPDAAWGAGAAVTLPTSASESTPTRTRFMYLSPESFNEAVRTGGNGMADRPANVLDSLLLE